MEDSFYRFNTADQDKKLDATLDTVNGKDVHRLRVDVSPKTLRYDSVDANTAYLGRAAPGSSHATAVWQIMKYDFSAGVDGRFADGNANYDNIWNNRASLSYP